MSLETVLEAMEENPLTKLEKEKVVDVYVDENNLDPQEQQFKQDYMDLVNDNEYEL